MSGSLVILLEDKMHELPATGRFFLSETFDLAGEEGKYTCVFTDDKLQINDHALQPYIPAATDGATLVWMLEAPL